MTTTIAGTTGGTLRYWAAVLIAFAVGAMLALVSTKAHAAPAAGTVIGNQATATYNDAGGTGRTATSNLVQTTVSQVKSFTLTADGARTAAPGQTVYYPHTITNTGNGTDAYTLNAPSSGNFAATGTGHGTLNYFIDANGDGIPDSATPIGSTGPIAAGGIFRFVVAGTVPAGAANGNTAAITVSVSDTAVTTTTNTDTTTVASSVISVTKSLGVSSGPSPNTNGTSHILVTLSYTNSGTAAASGVELRDTLPAGLTYVAGSGVWSGSGTGLTDAAGGDPAGIAYDYNITAANRVTAIITNVPAGFSGTVTFKVDVASGIAPGFINNTAQYQTSTQALVSTNTATYQVVQTAGVVANGASNNSTNGQGEPVTVASAGAGATFTFQDVIWNMGNAPDTFVVSLSGTASWPSGTTFTLLQQDNATSLIANTTPSIPVYSGSCPAGYVPDATNQRCGYVVNLRVQLPASASGGPYSVTMTAASSFDNTKTDTVIDTLTAVTSNTVDLTLGTALAPAGTATSGNAATTGYGTTGTGTIATNNVTPSTTSSTVSRFVLYVNNTGSVNDNFNLSTAGVPAGWSVVFKNDGGSNNCSTVGSTITSTGTTSAGANKILCAEVTVPAANSGQAAPGTYNLDFTATSTTNGSVSDSLRGAILVATVNSVALTPNNTQQTFPGGSVTYVHTVTNSGNVAESITFAAGFLTDSRSGSGWTSIGYVDGNNNGVFEPGIDDVPANAVSTSTTINLGVNQSRTIFVRVFAPPSAVSSDPANVTTLTARYNGGAASTSATDTTTVTDGLVLLKEQRTVNCDGTSPGTFSTGAIAASTATAPGKCLQYRISATNTTASGITLVVVSDNIPANTKQWNACGVPATTAGSISSPGDNATGTISASIGNLASLTSAQVTFCVRIDP
jgi:trimeric autotransporter adhesin